MNHEHHNDAPGQNKTYDVIVNGRPRTVTEHKLTYLQVVQLAFPGEAPSDKVRFEVSYSYPHGHGGLLDVGSEVVVKEGMILNVSKTNES